MTELAVDPRIPRQAGPRRTGIDAPPVEEPAGERPRDLAGRLAFLDGLRLLAALAVMMKHYIGTHSGVIGENLVHPWNAEGPFSHFGIFSSVAGYGWLGVQLFFIISGFVICMSAWGRSLGSFFASRVSRLMPAYWVAIALTAALLVLLPELSKGLPKGGIRNVLLNLTMNQAGLGGSNLDGSYWTLWYELRFYLVFAVVVAFGLTYRRVVLFCLIWSVAAIAASASGDNLLGFFAMPDYANYFVAGIAFFLIYKYGSTLLVWSIVGFSYIIALHHVWGDAGGQMWMAKYPPNFPYLVIAMTLIYGVMALVATHKTDGIRWRWLAVAGALTYPLYLIHQTLGYLLIDRLYPALPPVAVLAITVSTMLLTAYFIWRLVEQPFGGDLRRGLTASFESIRRSDRS